MKIVLSILFLLMPSNVIYSDQERLAPQAPVSTAVQQDDTSRVEVPRATEKAMRFYRTGNYIFILYTVLGLVIPAVFLFTGLSAKIRDAAVKIGRKRFFVIGIYFAVYSVILFLAYLPLNYWLGFLRLHDYGLSNQTFGKWLGDSSKSLMVSIVVGFLLLWIPYHLLKKSPKRWWLYISVLAVPFIILTILVVPVWIDPLYNDFGPMKNKDLEQKILALAERAGIEGGRVYEVNKSVDTEAVNAYVTGFGATKRIVLWDTIIEKLDDGKLLVVMGHEMGHYVLNHIHKMIAFLSVGILIVLYVIYRTAGFFLLRYKNRFGFDRLSDIASLPLFVLLINVCGFLGMPVLNSVSRYFERQCDTFACELTRDNHSGATAFVKLQSENLANPYPGPVYILFRATHPPIGERIHFFNTYRPWETGEPLQFDHLFIMGQAPMMKR